MILALLLALSQEFIPFQGNATGGNYLLPNLYAAWRFEQTTGNIADSSGSGFTLVENGSVAAISGVVGNARAFTTTPGNYFSYGSSTNFNFTNQFTISAWAQFDSSAYAVNDMSIIALGNYAGADFCWALTKDYSVPDDSIFFFYSTNGVFDFNLNTRLVITNQFDSAFYNIVVRYDGTTIRLTARRIDAEAYMPEATATPGLPLFAGPSELRVGTLQGSAQHNMGGTLDEIFIWKRYIADCSRDWLFTAKNGIFSSPAFNSLTCVNP